MALKNKKDHKNVYARISENNNNLAIVQSIMSSAFLLVFKPMTGQQTLWFFFSVI